MSSGAGATLHRGDGRAQLRRRDASASSLRRPVGPPLAGSIRVLRASTRRDSRRSWSVSSSASRSTSGPIVTHGAAGTTRSRRTSSTGTLGVPEVDRWLVERRAELGAHTSLEPLWPDGQAFCGLPDARRRRPLRTLDASASGAPRDRRSPPRRGRTRPVAASHARQSARARAMRRGLSRSPSTLDTIELSSDARDCARRLSVVLLHHACRAAAAADTTARTRRRTAARSAVRGRPSPSSSGRSPTTGSTSDFMGATTRQCTRACSPPSATRFESATGITPTTTRQHFLHWDIARTPQLQNAAGFTADATLGFNRTVGFRASTALPFRQFDVTADEALPLLEVPLVVEDSALLGPIAERGGLDHARERVQRAGRRDTRRRRCHDVPVPSRQAAQPGLARALRVVASVLGGERRAG